MTRESIPPAEAVADFLLSAAALKLPLKATAGLHSPVPRDGTHGFLNFFAAGFLAYSGRGARDRLVRVLSDFGYGDFSFGDDSMRCGDVRFSRDEIAQLRSRWLLSFGSCSFLEPVEYLENHGLIEP